MSAPDFIWAVVGYMKGADVRGEFAAEADVFVPGQKLEPYIRRDPAVIAALPEVQALVAAALERAADDLADYPRTSPDYDDWTRYDEQIEHSQAIVRALVPTDHAAALEAVKDAVWEEAAKVADEYEREQRNDAELWRKDKMPQTGLLSDAMANGARRIAAALRARKDKP
jgi:hypothetical protein